MGMPQVVEAQLIEKHANIKNYMIWIVQVNVIITIGYIIIVMINGH